jgi:1-acyl-sn-glycerol-3-phosphate acyltransferase
VKSIMSTYGRFILVENGDLLNTAPDPCIFVFNHNNYWETVVVGSYLMHHRPGKKMAFICDWMFGRIPLVRWFFKRIDPIYTYSKKARFASLNKHKQTADGQAVCQACLERLRNRQSLGIFPEGARNPDPYQLRRGRKGVGEIVLRSGAPVLPVGIDFPRRGGNGRFPLFSPMILRFGRLLTFAEEGAAHRAAAREPQFSPMALRKLHYLLGAGVTHAIMLELARLSGKDYPFPPPPISPQAQSYIENFSRKGAFL